MEKREKVLVLEGRNLVVDAKNAALLRRHFDAYFTSNGEEALEIAKAVRPQVIVADCLPISGMSGTQLAYALRGDGSTAEIKLVCCGLGQLGIWQVRLLDYNLEELFHDPQVEIIALPFSANTVLQPGGILPH